MSEGTSRADAAAGAPAAGAAAPRTCTCLPGRKAKADKEGARLSLGAGDAFELRQDHGCTDLLCTVLFVVFWGLMLTIAGVGLSSGQPDRYALV